MFIQTALAASNGGILQPQMDFGDFILLAIAVIVLLAGVFAIIFILWGGLLLILSGGKDEKIKPAINSIRYALIGLVIIAVSIFAFPMLGGLLGLDVTKYSSPELIFGKIRELGEKLNFSSHDSIGKPNNNNDIFLD